MKTFAILMFLVYAGLVPLNDACASKAATPERCLPHETPVKKNPDAPVPDGSAQATPTTASTSEKIPPIQTNITATSNDQSSGNSLIQDDKKAPATNISTAITTFTSITMVPAILTNTTALPSVPAILTNTTTLPSVPITNISTTMTATPTTVTPALNVSSLNQSITNSLMRFNEMGEFANKAVESLNNMTRHRDTVFNPLRLSGTRISDMNSADQMIMMEGWRFGIDTIQSLSQTVDSFNTSILFLNEMVIIPMTTYNYSISEGFNVSAYANVSVRMNAAFQSFSSNFMSANAHFQSTNQTFQFNQLTISNLDELHRRLRLAITPINMNGEVRSVTDEITRFVVNINVTAKIQ